MVVRVGDGMAALGSAATPVFLEERSLSGALLAKANNPLALPTAVSGNNYPLTLSGTAASEGNLARSANGAYVTLAGFGATVGTASVAGTSSATVNRVIARVDASGNVNTSTRFDAAFNTMDIRGVTTDDGTAFWASGTGSGSTGGVQYITLGSVGGLQILGAPNNARDTQIFAGQLYGTSGSGAFVNVFTIGAGLPTGPGQVATSLPGMPGSGASPYSFALFDRTPNVAGVDTLYVADDRTIANGGGVQKWTYDGATWSLAATFNQGISTGVRGLAAFASGNEITVIATTAETNQNTVVVYIDNGGASPMGTVVATAGANTVFRGVALSPQ